MTNLLTGSNVILMCGLMKVKTNVGIIIKFIEWKMVESTKNNVQSYLDILLHITYFKRKAIIFVLARVLPRYLIETTCILIKKYVPVN